MKLYVEQLLGKKINRVHFIGIGGTSMSGLALILLSRGIHVSGSDMKESIYTKKLKRQGATVYIGHNAKNMTRHCDLVVYSAAINGQNPEMIRAKELNIPLMERSEFLGTLTKDYAQTIAVSGTHGKTTTSSLISALLTNAHLDPTVSIGGSLDLIGGNYRVGHSDYFVTEACEYVDSFLQSHHRIAIILNIEMEHMDYFKTMEQLKHSFRAFAKIVPDDGLVIAYGDSKDVLDVVENLACNVVTFGTCAGNQWQAVNITYDPLGKPYFDVLHQGNLFDHYQLEVPGEHNVLNALASIICADYFDISKAVIKDTLASFKGAHRRFEFRGEVNGIKVYEDYAHHPTELKVTVEACRNYDYRKLWVVFQAHTYSRAYFFFDDFVNAFKGADFVIINDIYSDREANTYHVHAEDMASAIKDRLNIPAIHLSKFEDIVTYLVDNTEKDDFVLVAGSQTINQVAFDLVHALEKNYMG